MDQNTDLTINRETSLINGHITYSAPSFIANQSEEVFVVVEAVINRELKARKFPIELKQIIG